MSETTGSARIPQSYSGKGRAYLEMRVGMRGSKGFRRPVELAPDMVGGWVWGGLRRSLAGEDAGFWAGSGRAAADRRKGPGLRCHRSKRPELHKGRSFEPTAGYSTVTGLLTATGSAVGSLC